MQQNKPSPFLKGVIPAHLHHLKDQLPPETIEMFEINRVIQQLSEVIDHNERLEQVFKSSDTSSKLENLLKSTSKDTQNLVTIDGDKLAHFLENLNKTLDFWNKERTQVKQIWEQVKNIGYYLEQDPISEKIKTSNDSIAKLKNWGQQLERRVILLSAEQNNNLKLQGTIKEMELKLREKDELVSKLYSKIANLEKEILNQNSKQLELEAQNDALQSDIESFKETLKLFKIESIYSTQTQLQKHKNYFSSMLEKPKILNEVVSFLIPRDMLELSLTSKLVNSQVRHFKGIFATVASNSMWDKENIQFTTLKGKNLFF